MKRLLPIVIGLGLICTLVYCGFLIYAASIPEDVYERQAEIVQAHYAWLGDIYRVANEKLDAEISCPADVIPPEEPLSPLYAPYLRRFTTQDAETWAEHYEEWDWLTASKLLEEIDSPTARNHYASTRAIESLTRYVAVIWPAESAQNRLPLAPNLENYFHFEAGVWEGELFAGEEAIPTAERIYFRPGTFEGWLAIVDTETASLLCRGIIEVRSSDSAAFRFVHRSRSYTPSHALSDDFAEQFQRAGQQILPPGVSIDLGQPPGRMAEEAPTIFAW